MIFPAPGVDLQNTFQNDLPELPSEPPGSPPGGPREPQEATRAPQDDPKSRPEGRKSRPCGLRAALAATWGKPGAQKPPRGLQDAILAPSGLDLGPFGNRFWRPPKTRLGASRELWGIHFLGTMLNIFWTLPEPIAASFRDFPGFVPRALGPAVLPNFGRTWQRRRRNIKRVRVAQDPPRGLKGALGDPFWV